MTCVWQVSLAASLIFNAVDGSNQDDETTYLGRNGVAWVLRFGGFCTLVRYHGTVSFVVAHLWPCSQFGALVARSLPLTKTEEEMQYILDELTTLSKEDEHP